MQGNLVDEISRRLAQALAGGDLDHTLSSITTAAIELLADVEHASITVSPDLHAHASFPLLDSGSDRAALNLYGDRAGAVDDTGDAARVFAHQSAIALEFARHISDLEQAAASRQSIGRAVGATMEHLDLDDARALAFLARVSQQDANGRFRVTAEELLHDALARHAHPRERCAACPTPCRVPTA